MFEKTQVKEVSPAGWFAIRILLDTPYVYRFDGEKWWVNNDGKEYFLFDNELGVRVVAR